MLKGKGIVGNDAPGGQCRVEGFRVEYSEAVNHRAPGSLQNSLPYWWLVGNRGI